MSNSHTIPEKFASSFERALGALMTADGGLDFLKQALASKGLGATRLAAPEFFPRVTDPQRLKNAKVAIIADTEATSPKPLEAEVIEIGLVKVLYDEKEILDIIGIHHQYQQPSAPITPEITMLTGITNEDVAGKKINTAAVNAFLEGADRVIFHHASYDRTLWEKELPDVAIRDMVVDCSLHQIDWKKRGISSPKLELLCARFGIATKAHTAVGDSVALAFVLNEASSDSEVTPFAECLSVSDEPMVQLIVPYVPFDHPHTGEKLNEVMKRPVDEGGFGFRFSMDGSECGDVQKAWWGMVRGEQELRSTVGRLKADVFCQDFEFTALTFSPTCRYSQRPERREVLSSDRNHNVMALLAIKRRTNLVSAQNSTFEATF